jgi:hypothetical protein
VTLRNVAQLADALATLSIVSNAGAADKREAERGCCTSQQLEQRPN